MTHDAVVTHRSGGTVSSAAGVTVTARWLFGRLLSIGKWFAGIALLVFSLVPPLIDRLGGRLDFSIWEHFTNNGPAWFSLAMGATLVANYLTMTVAHGVTRRRFAIAAALALAATALALAVFVWLGFGLEAFYFERFQWRHALIGEHLFGSTSQWPLVIAQYTVRNLLFGLVGMIVGYGYYRCGGMWGTALLPFTLVVPLAFGLAVLGMSGIDATFSLAGLPKTTATGLGLALPYCVALLLVCRLLLATVPVRTKTG